MIPTLIPEPAYNLEVSLLQDRLYPAQPGDEETRPLTITTVPDHFNAPAAGGRDRRAVSPHSHLARIRILLGFCRAAAPSGFSRILSANRNCNLRHRTCSPNRSNGIKISVG